MSIKPPDMNICSRKLRILSGPNAGLVIDPQDPCPEGYSWDEEQQDCVQNPS